MNTNSNLYRDAQRLGNSLIGKKAQSRLLTEISNDGRQVLRQPMLITGFEIVESFAEPTVIVTIDGEGVFEDVLINIH